MFGKPTVLNNVETYANIPVIILKEPNGLTPSEPKSKGTKVFAVGGNIVNTGLVEIAMEPPYAKSFMISAAVFPTVKV